MPDRFNCPNRHNHINSEPGFDRVLCPYCQDGVYVIDLARQLKEDQQRIDFLISQMDVKIAGKIG